MTAEQQILFDITRSQARLALQHLDATDVTLALVHLKEAQRSAELFQAARPTSKPNQISQPTNPVIEV